MESLRIDVRGNAVRFSVYVQPRASNDEIVGLHGTALKVRLRAPPGEGTANDALGALFARPLSPSAFS